MRAATSPVRNEPTHAGPRDDGIGRGAQSPMAIPWRGWKQVMRRVFSEISSDKISLVAAGCAFYATLALFPAISMLVSLYGLVFDPATVEPQLQTIREFVPPAAFQLIDQRVHTLVSHGNGTLGVGLLVSTLLTLWSASTGTKSMISALNLAYEETERRGFIRFQATGIAMTLSAIIGVILAIAILVFMPVALDFVGLTAYASGLIRLASAAVLVLFVALSLSMLYRFGPCRRAARWKWVTPGSLLATVLWLIASAMFSFYVARLSSYDATYGPIGAVIAIMMWFWVSAYVVLLGAELNAELELQTEHDSTQGGPAPIGQRGAYVADHVADS